MIILWDSEAILLQYFIGVEFSNINISNIPNRVASDSAIGYVWRKAQKSLAEKFDICLVRSTELCHSARTADYLSCTYICYISESYLFIFCIYIID